MEPIIEIFRSSLFWLTFVVLVIYLYLKYIVYNRWDKKEVPHDLPSIPLGNVPLSYFTGHVTHVDIIQKSYEKYRKFRFHGLYILYQSMLVITDPELIQLVLVKNFTEFYNRGSLSDVHKDPLSLSLNRLRDEKWKRMRKLLTPTFTSGKLKLMYPLFKEICDELINVCNGEIEKSEVVEIKDLVTRYTVDCITSTTLGFNCKSLQNPDNEVLKCAKMSNKLSKTFLLFTFFIPNLTGLVPLPESRKMVGKFFIQLFEDMVASRRKNNVIRNDFLQMLIQLMDYGKVEDTNETTKTSLLDQVPELDKMTMMEAVGQSFFFFSTGQETSASTIIGCLYELAFNEDIQAALFTEISDTYNNFEEVTYETIFSLKYLDLVLQETLRKYSAISMLNRICVKDFEIPNSNFTIKKGTRVIIPYDSIHKDADIYPEPDKFDPDRFLPENKSKRHKFTYLPFGEGPRKCIAERLAVLKVKIAIFYLILNYKLSPCDKTFGPIKYQPDYFVQSPGDVYLKMERREISKK